MEARGRCLERKGVEVTSTLERKALSQPRALNHAGRKTIWQRANVGGSADGLNNSQRMLHNVVIELNSPSVAYREVF